MRLRPALPGEAAGLSTLALRSKGHWGYDADFLEACRGELTLRDDELAVRRTLVAEVDGALAGFGTLEGAPPYGELGMLFVDPAVIVPVHYEGWTHFKQGRAAAEPVLSASRFADRVRWIDPGEATEFEA